MSVLINMDMPFACSVCRLETEDCRCSALYSVVDTPEFGKLKDCPLIEVPDFHFDLIDRSVLNLAIMDGDCGTEKELVKHILDCINNAPAVVPAIKEADE